MQFFISLPFASHVTCEQKMRLHPTCNSCPKSPGRHTNSGHFVALCPRSSGRGLHAYIPWGGGKPYRANVQWHGGSAPFKSSTVLRTVQHRAMSLKTRHSTATPLAPVTDFFVNLRKGNKAVDAGAVEYEPVATAVLTVTSTWLAFTGVVRGQHKGQP